MRSTKAKKFATSAIALIQSESMRKWALSERNLPIIVQLAGETLAKNAKADPQSLATYLTLVALG